MGWLVFGVVFALLLWALWPPPGSRFGPIGESRGAKVVFRWRDGHWMQVGWQYSTGRKVYLPLPGRTP